MKPEWKRLQELVGRSRSMVFFGGAGVSTESGIPDFRSVDGLYGETYRHPPERMMSYRFLMECPDEFFAFYRAKMLYPDAVPNAAHSRLAEWEAAGRLRAVVTQNIDGLHQTAGSRAVVELHGSVHRNFCVACGARYPLGHILGSEGVPRCTACGGMVRPDVVLYEEPLDTAVLERAVSHLRGADLLLIGGTSLTVYPAAGLLRYFGGEHVVVINRASTAMDGSASLLIADPIGAVLGAI